MFSYPLAGFGILQEMTLSEDRGGTALNDFWLPFELEAATDLDNFALLARQDYNLGGSGGWFSCFRGGLYGFYARLHGVKVHFHEVHAWRPSIRSPTETEFLVASVLFNMDSAMECFVFALNALGNAVNPGDFMDVTNAKALRQVNPLNITGGDAIPPVPGYLQYFPALQRHWQSHQSLLKAITEQHDVSKHRQTIYSGGKVRGDPPQGFFESLGVPEDAPGRILLHPQEEILLLPDAKTPPAERKVSKHGDALKFEALTNSYCEFINTSCVLALEDARSQISLPHLQFMR